MRPLKAAVGLCLLSLILAGCGQKGPLYLPDETPASTQSR